MLLEALLPPHEELIFPAPQSGQELLTQEMSDYLPECLNVKNICHSYSTKILFSHSCCPLPAPHQSVVYIPEPFYFHSQHSESEASRMAPPRVRKSPTQAVPLGTDGHWTEPTGAGRGGELRTVQPRAQDGAWHTGNDGLQAQAPDAGSEISLPAPLCRGPHPHHRSCSKQPWRGRVMKSGLHMMSSSLRRG